MTTIKESKTSQSPIITRNNHLPMPQIGLGVLKAKEDGEVEKAILSALDVGYRKIDTAAVYGNETGVGKAMHQSGIPREEVFLTSKVWNSDQGYDNTLHAFEKSLNRLQTDYLDPYLVHWPVKDKYIDTYKALEKLYREGRVRSIGVSNFQVHHLTKLLQHTQVIPAVNQIELHPHLQQEELIKFSKQINIQLEAWRPIMMGEVQHIPELISIGQKYGKSPVQVTLRWLTQIGISVIPKSVTPQRIASNFQIFDFSLSNEDIAIIQSLNQNRRLGPDPDNFNF